jgi:hypothetical protein
VSGSLRSSASPRWASRAVSSCAYSRAALWAARFQYSAARTFSRATSRITAMSAALSDSLFDSRAMSASAMALLNDTRRVIRSVS